MKTYGATSELVVREGRRLMASRANSWFERKKEKKNMDVD
jgi:hypothetical protein